MTYTLSWETLSHTATIVSDSPIPADNSDVWSLLQLILKLQASLSLIDFDYVRQSVSNEIIPYSEYKYTFETQDGRKWKQTIRVYPTLNTSTMSFNVADLWRVDEFADGRPIRDLLITLSKQYGIVSVKLT